MEEKNVFPSFNKKPKEEQIPKGQILDITEKESVEALNESDGNGTSASEGVETNANPEVEKTVTVNRDEYNRLRQERDDFLNHLQRLQAEFDNYRKRVQKEKSELRDYLIQDFIYRMLGVIDNMDRALHPDNTTNDVNTYRQGVEMVFQQTINILKEQGLCRMETVGIPFDPHRHEAVGQIESSEYEPGTIVSEFMPGYSIKDRVLRAPKVVVAIKPAESANQVDAATEKTE